MAVAQQIKGNQAIFNSGGILALSTALQDISAAIASRKQKLKSLTITMDASGTVIFCDGASPNPVIAAFGVIANTPLTVDENRLQGLAQSSVGASIQVKAGSATPNATITGICDLE